MDDRRKWLGLGLAGGVGVDVLLARQVADLVHHLVGDLTQHQPVRRVVAVLLDRDGATETQVHTTEHLRSLGVRRLHQVAADDSDGNDRRVGPQCEASQPGVPLVQQTVAGTCALGIDPEEFARVEHACRCVESTLRGVTAGPVDRDHADGREHVLGLPVVQVLGLADIGHATTERQRHEEGVEHRDVVRGDDGAAGLRDVLETLGADVPQESERRCEHETGGGLQPACLAFGRASLLSRHGRHTTS